MDVMYGEAGPAGHDSLPQDLTWLHTEPLDRGAYRQLPESIRPVWLDVHTELVRKARDQETNRLTGPIQFVLKLLGFWRLQANDAVGLLGFNSVDAEHVAAVLGGHEQFRGRDVRDRIAHLFHIRATLRSLFRDLETENNWLREPHPLLDERSPLSLMLGGSMEDLLLTKEYVQSVAGRGRGQGFGDRRIGHFVCAIQGIESTGVHAQRG